MSGMSDDDTREYIERMAGRYDDDLEKLFRKVEKAWDKGKSEKADALFEEIEGHVYGSSIERVVTLTLAGGGPSLWLECHIDEDGDLMKVESFASWGFDGPIVKNHVEGSGLWKLAERMTDGLGSYGRRDW